VAELEAERDRLLASRRADSERAERKVCRIQRVSSEERKVF
jgi:hypothetical protein